MTDDEERKTEYKVWGNEDRELVGLATAIVKMASSSEFIDYLRSHENQLVSVTIHNKTLDATVTVDYRWEKN